MFRAFLQDAMLELDQDTSHRAYHSVVGVLRAFRERLTVQQALDFAEVLPAVLRAIFVSSWVVASKPKPFGSHLEQSLDVRSVQRDHNFAPDNAIPSVARALRRHVDQASLERALAKLPPEARSFWAG